MNDKVYDNIIELIKELDSSIPINEILNGRIIKYHPVYEMVNNNGQYLPVDIGSVFFKPNYFRGENNVFENIIPNIYRSHDDTDRIISEIKLIEWELTLKKIPYIVNLEENNYNIDYLALAQHYGLKTNLIDLSSNLLVAAFFATNNCDDNYTIKEDGIGVIRILPQLYAYNINENGLVDTEFNKHFHIESIQPFKRPAIQSALGFELKNNDLDEQKLFYTFKFKQNKNYNNLIRNQFCMRNKCDLFPDEEISIIANSIKISKYISRYSLIEYCKRNNYNIIEIEKKIRKSIVIKDRFIVKINQSIINKINKDIQSDDYEVYSRLSIN